MNLPDRACKTKWPKVDGIRGRDRLFAPLNRKLEDMCPYFTITIFLEYGCPSTVRRAK